LKAARGGASVSVLNQIEEALRAAAISETGREALARGRFVEPMRAEGFDVFSQLAPAAPKQSRSRVNPASKKEALRKADEALKQARSRLRDAEGNAGQAAREAERLSRELDKARSDAEAAQLQVDEAARDVEDAEATLKKARRK
jgi:chromosome segregation ATPase